MRKLFIICVLGLYAYGISDAVLAEQSTYYQCKTPNGKIVLQDYECSKSKNYHFNNYMNNKNNTSHIDTDLRPSEIWFLEQANNRQLMQMQLDSQEKIAVIYKHAEIEKIEDFKSDNNK